MSDANASQSPFIRTLIIAVLVLVVWTVLDLLVHGAPRWDAASIGVVVAVLSYQYGRRDRP